MDEKKDAGTVKVARLEQAQKKIEKALSKAGLEYIPEHIHDTLESLYAAYEANGTVPTREAFAECCPDEEIREFVRTMEKDPFMVDSKKKIAAIAAGVAAVLVICGVAYGLSATNEQTTNDPLPTATASPEAAASMVDVMVKAEGADAESTKAKVEILNEAGEAVVTATEITANEESSLGDLAEGKYALRVVQAPVNTDGSTYKLPEANTEFTVGAKGDPISVEVTLEKLNVEDMSKEQLEATAAVLKNSGKPEASQAVEAKATAAPSRPGSAGQVTAEPTPAPSKPTGGNSGSSSTPDPKPSHTHTWVEQTKTVHHDAEYKTVHHDAVTESIVVCLDCGAENPGRDHLKQHVIEGGNGGTTVKTVIVKEAYDEKVLVKDAYDEVVVVGYKCSGCGATK